MSAFFHKAESQLFVEFSEGAAQVTAGDKHLEVQATPEALRNAIGLVASSSSASQVYCLLPAKGLSLRKISLPAKTRAEIDRLLPMQIEAHFPVSAEDLAWGYLELPARGPLKELLVAAIKKDLLAEYRGIIAGAGFTPIFVVAALARRALLPRETPPFAILDNRGSKNELLVLEADGNVSLRAAGAEAIPTGCKAATLPSAAPTTAIAGLREMLRRGESPLILHPERDRIAPLQPPAQWRWAAAAALLLLAFLALRMAEPSIRKRQAERRLAELKAQQAKLPNLEREVSFLQFLKTNQPSYLDALATVAASVAPGTKMDSLTLSRRGELSFRGTVQGQQGPTPIRAKLLDSGAFSLVTIDEQTPVQNNQQVNFRLTGLMRPENERPLTKAAQTNPPPAKPAATNTAVAKTSS